MLGVVLAFVFVAVARLPEAFVTQLEHRSPFTTAQAGWAFRLLALAAFAQAAYGGFSVLQVDRVREARASDDKVSRMSRQEIAEMVSRNAAYLVALTIVYGIATLAMTGERGSFWLFAVLSLAQAAWYFRQTRQITEYLSVQSEQDPSAKPPEAWHREPDDYSPPLARAMDPSDPAT